MDEPEVLRRWADGYDTRLFVRRRIHETEPVIGVVGGLDLTLFQHLRVAAGGNTLVPTENVAKALGALGYEGDAYDVLASGERLALYLELPAPIVGEMLEDLGREGFTDFPEPPPEAAEPEDIEGEPDDSGVVSEGGSVAGGAASEEREQKPSPEDRAARRATSEDPGSGNEPSRVQDPQASDAPGVAEEGGDKKQVSPPEGGREDAPGTPDREQ